MDERTARLILNIKPETSYEDISKRYEHFIKLYKLYLMGENLSISPEQLEQMKKAYLTLLYKRIDDTELAGLYPQYHQGPYSEFCHRILIPFLNRERPKIIYTAVMCSLSIIIIFIMNFTPADLKIAVFTKPYDSVMDYQIRDLYTNGIEAEIPEIILGIRRPIIYYENYNSNSDLPLFVFSILTKYDVCIMEEDFLKRLKNEGVEFLNLSGIISRDTIRVSSAYKKAQWSDGIVVNKNSGFYEKICNLEEENLPWVAVVSQKVRNRKQALEFLRFLCTPTR